MNAEKAVRKHAAQHDLFNRLHSIAADEGFVQRVAQEWFGGRFEVVGGSWLRCRRANDCEPALRDVVLRPRGEQLGEVCS